MACLCTTQAGSLRVGAGYAQFVACMLETVSRIKQCCMSGSKASRHCELLTVSFAICCHTVYLAMGMVAE